MSWGSAIFAEGIGTFMLMFAILGIVDSRSPGDFAGLVIGGVVVAIIMVVGPITGASLNPARAFGPELVSALGDGVDALEPADPRLHPARPRRRGPGGRCSTTSWPTRGSSRRRSRKPSPTPIPPRATSRRPRSEGGALMATVTTPMKKLLNDPAELVKESLAGSGRRARRPAPLRRRSADRRARRRAGAGQGRAGLGRRLRPRAAPRRVRRAAACSTPRARARCSPRRCPSRCSRRPRRSTAARASCTSSRTTPATS